MTDHDTGQHTSARTISLRDREAVEPFIDLDALDPVVAQSLSSGPSASEIVE